PVGCVVTDGATFVSLSAPLRYGAAAATPARLVAAGRRTARASSATRRGRLTLVVVLAIPSPLSTPLGCPELRGLHAVARRPSFPPTHTCEAHRLDNALRGTLQGGHRPFN